MSMSDPKQDPRTAERVEDLDVPEQESEDVKGGLPAVQAAREAAGRKPISKGGGEIQVESFQW
jgi:hypothetical protein